MSQRVQGKHRQWQAMLQAEMSHAPDATRALCEPATRLNPIETMLLLRRLRPEQVASLSPPAVARLVAMFRERAETLVFANPLLREALNRTAKRSVRISGEGGGVRVAVGVTCGARAAGAPRRGGTP